MMRARAIGWLAAALVAAGGAAAEDAPRDVRDFTFRRVAPPGAGERPGLVQIDPAEQAALLAVPEPPAVVASAPPREAVGGPAAWFWQAVSPRRDDAGPARVAAALAAAAGAGDSPGAPMPRLDHLRRIADRHGRDILAATVGTRVSPALVLSVISVESAGRPDAVSHAGATGLMQLMPATAARFDVADARAPDQNIRGGVAYLDWLMGTFDGDAVLALAAYNAGEGAVREHDGVPPYAETRAYVPKVLAAWDVAAGLCLTRPELISDGCVFVTAAR